MCGFSKKLVSSEQEVLGNSGAYNWRPFCLGASREGDFVVDSSTKATAGDGCVGFFRHGVEFAQALEGVLRSVEKLSSFMYGVWRPSLRLL